MTAEYALLGDLRTAALVSRAGSVDWMCLPRFDGGSCFGRLLGDGYGACAIEVDGDGGPEGRRYREGTLVLETTLRAAGGEATLTECLLGGDDGPRPALLRVVDGVRGTVPLKIRIEPRFDYGEVKPWIRHHGTGLFTAIGGNDGLLCWSDGGLEADGRHALAATATVRAGDRLRLLVASAPPEDLDDVALPDAGALDSALAETAAAWRDWSARSRFDGPDAAAARRSALVLKALTYGRTGAMVAAATTSLPETTDGERRWDYRYSWIRDAVLASRSLTRLGYEEEAGAFRSFIERSSAGNAEDLQVFFGPGGERRLPEQDIGGVRVGNGAAHQLQLDAYGHLLEQSWRWYERGHPPDDDYWRFLVELVDEAVERWQEPDRGLWEWRGEPRHFTYSKAMCWAAADRGLELARLCLRKAPERRWRKARDEIREAVLEQGYDARRGTFVQAFGERDLDAAVLRLPMIGLLPYDDERMVSTVDVLRDVLGDGGLLRRYDADDDLPGREGAFLACSFWLVECLAHQGRLDDARAVFDAATATANDLGLFAEEYDPESRRMLGNFPQALSHLAHVEAALALADVERAQ